MSDRMRSIAGLVTGLLIAGLGWITDNGIQSLTELNPLTNLQTSAAFLLVLVGVMAAWFTNSPKQVNKRRLP
jgi:hypothetical protein